MPSESERSSLPDWARRERQQDLEWIQENFHIFWPVATAGFEALGRGALFVDTTSGPIEAGHPFAYIPQDIVEIQDDEDVKRMVKTYDPSQEFVIVLLKAKDRTSTYRLQALQPPGRAA